MELVILSSSGSYPQKIHIYIIESISLCQNSSINTILKMRQTWVLHPVLLLTDSDSGQIIYPSPVE